MLSCRIVVHGFDFVIYELNLWIKKTRQRQHASISFGALMHMEMEVSIDAVGFHFIEVM